ncbi:DUF1254 domain-containing protein [Acetobacter malorum]|uniref:DUF1254 domain-containing protein n=1 Tax=Acetobacter malorum TaxID=178901 RepID=UPI0039E78A7A
MISFKTPDRRGFMTLATSAGLVSLFTSKFLHAQVPPAVPPLPPFAEASSQAWIFTVPLIEMALARTRILKATLPNKLLHKRILSDWQDRFITTPNNDTLYSVAWLDLAAGPVQLQLPATGDRYISAALIDTYTNNFAILGTRTTGNDGGSFTIIGPEQSSHSSTDIRSPTRWACLLIRTLVNDPQDLPAAHDVQDRIVLQAPSVAKPPALTIDRNAPWQDYFSVAQNLLAESPAFATDKAILQKIAPLGLSANHRFDPNGFSDAQAAEIRLGLEHAKSDLANRSTLGTHQNGWFWPKPDLGDFKQDYLYRAQVAVGGLLALPNDEALYLVAALTPEQQECPAGKSLLLHFPAGQLPPVNAFWSLSLYEATREHQYFFTRNPINRYTIGDRTPGLIKNTDGSLDIIISRQKPATAKQSANWLPAPAHAPFGLFLRTYLPQQTLLNHTWTVPTLQLIDNS